MLQKNGCIPKQVDVLEDHPTCSCHQGDNEAVILCSQRPQPTASGQLWVPVGQTLKLDVSIAVSHFKDLSGPVSRYVCMSVCTWVLMYVRKCVPGYVGVWVYGCMEVGL